MFYSDKLDETLYVELMEQIKKVNADWLQLRKSREYRMGLVVNEVCQELLHVKMSALRKSLNRWIKGAKSGKIKSDQKINNSFMPRESNYFSTERIAIYTVVFGAYDRVPEPYCRPDNCDFYIFTDQPFDDSQSAWKKRNVPDGLVDLDNAGKNRYLKMHPNELFPEYRFSIYVDGNVQIMTDLTEYINMIGEIGIATHLHDSRNCVYDELEAIRKTKRASVEDIERHKRYFSSTKMPRHYGLLQCNVIFREHHNPICIAIMDEWWKEYLSYTKRDQISLPHVLHQHGIPVEKVGVCGTNIYTNPSFRILNHV